MCTELLLALIYFCTILFVNYFLFKILKFYWIGIIDLLKIKNIFQLFSKDIIFNQMILFLKKKNQIKPKLILNDILIIGNSYDYFFQKSNEKNYYCILLKLQYLNKLNNGSFGI